MRSTKHCAYSSSAGMIRLRDCMALGVAAGLLVGCNGDGPTVCNDPTPAAGAGAAAADVVLVPPRVPSPERPAQSEHPPITIKLVESSRFINAIAAREDFKVSGAGLTVAVLDTGIFMRHKDFDGGSKVVAQHNFTSDNASDPADAADGNGHGTHVAGIIAASGVHTGIAPGASVVALKVLSDTGGGTFEQISQGLEWVLRHHAEHRISVVSMSLGAPRVNLTTDENLPDWARHMAELVRQLSDLNIPVIIAAGNDFCDVGSQEGMSFPGIIRQGVSVGAVYDADEGGFSYGCASAVATRPGALTPFSQRLHPSTNDMTCTDIFAPGAPVTSTGIISDTSESTQHGTSQATPITAGVVLLLQEYYLTHVAPPTGAGVTPPLPPVDSVVRWLRAGGVRIFDGDDERDSVVNTCKDYIRLDAYGALDVLRRELRLAELRKAKPEFIPATIGAAPKAPLGPVGARNKETVQ